MHADEKRIRVQAAILDETPGASLGLSITMFSVRMCVSSVQKTWLARAARNSRSATLVDETACFELQRQDLRGRRPVRADHRLHADEKRIRAQAAILDRSKPERGSIAKVGKPGAAHG
ncbi:MAG: hypothetical protein IH605_14855 [Burkholderiales bacterium]|nr:hypothetical protein [Burkholderiales bacterium]